MARRCELTGKGVMVGNNVSHAHNKTKRRFLPNLNQVNLISETLDQSFRFRVTSDAIRSVEHAGGLDAYLRKTPDSRLSPRARKIKHRIAKLTAGETVGA